MTVDLHSLIAPYALHALDADDLSRFEAHLDQCPDCRAELAGFQATAALLAETEAEQPPASLRASLLTAVASTPQERPVVTALAQHSRLRRTLPRLVMAAAILLGTVGVGGYLVERHQASDYRATNDTITSVLAAEDAATVARSFDGGGNVRLVSSTTKDAAVIVANDLPRLRGGKVYQVWMIEGTSPRSEGVFTSSGTMIMQDVTKADRVAITVEPAGGSKKPTTAPITTIPV